MKMYINGLNESFILLKPSFVQENFPHDIRTGQSLQSILFTETREYLQKKVLNQIQRHTT